MIADQSDQGLLVPILTSISFHRVGDFAGMHMFTIVLVVQNRNLMFLGDNFSSFPTGTMSTRKQKDHVDCFQIKVKEQLQFEFRIDEEPQDNA